MRFSLVSILAALPILGFSQSVKLDFGSVGTRDVWIAENLPTSAPKDTTRLTDSGHVLDITQKSKKSLAFVWDQSTGLVAMKPISELKEVWKITASDYKYIGFLTVKLESKGSPVSAATIKLTDGKRTVDHLLDPSMKGEARFFVIQPGRVSVLVNYNSGGKPALAVDQTFSIDPASASPEVRLVIALPDATETVGSTTPATSAPALKEGNTIGRIIFFLVVLSAAVAFGYFLLQIAKKNQDALQAKLKELGVQIPDPQAGDGPNAPIPAQPEPIKPILLGDGPPEPIGVVSHVSSPSGEPKLVDASGAAHVLEDGEVIVSRDSGAGFSLVGESTVSRSHAKIIRTGQTVLVEDLGSTNGTFVNGAKISTQVELKPGDAVQFGAVKFRFEG